MSLPEILIDNRFNDGRPEASSTADGYNTLNLLDWRPFTYWKAGASGTVTITIDCGAANPADTLGLCNHNIASAGGTVSVECSSDQFSTDVTVALAPFAPASDGVIYRHFDAQTKRWWRLKITGLTTAPYIAIAAIGSRITFPVDADGEFAPVSESPQLESAVSNGGHLLGVVRKATKISASISMEYMPESFFTDTFMPAWRSHLAYGVPFFYAPYFDGAPQDVYLMRARRDFSLDGGLDTLARRRMTLELEGVQGYGVAIDGAAGDGGGGGGGGGCVGPGVPGELVLQSTISHPSTVQANGYTCVVANNSNRFTEIHNLFVAADGTVFLFGYYNIDVGGGATTGARTAAVLRSSDGGVTWSDVTPASARIASSPTAVTWTWAQNMLQCPGGQLLLHVRAVGTYRSTDGGVTWSLLSVPWAATSDVNWDADQARILVAANPIIMSVDNGDTWTSLDFAGTPFAGGDGSWLARVTNTTSRYSPDGEVWQLVTHPSFSGSTKAVYMPTAGVWVVWVLNERFFLYSADGINFYNSEVYQPNEYTDPVYYESYVHGMAASCSVAVAINGTMGLHDVLHHTSDGVNFTTVLLTGTSGDNWFLRSIYRRGAYWYFVRTNIPDPVDQVKVYRAS